MQVFMKVISFHNVVETMVNAHCNYFLPVIWDQSAHAMSYNIS